MKTFTKLYSFSTFIWNRLLGKISFPRSKVGQAIRLDSGNKVEIFRQVIFNRARCKNANAVLFHVKFHIKGMSPRVNKLFSIIPIPFFVGLPGFCAKFWCIDASNGDFHGFYKWKSKEHAEEYLNSFAMKFMVRRAVPNSIDFEILEYQGNKYGAYPDTP